MSTIDAPVASLRELATATDGAAVVNTNDLAGGLARLAADLTSYYLLGYYTTNPASDGGFRRVDVRVKRRGLVVRARRGYRAISASELAAARTAALAAGQTVGTAATAVEAAIAALAQSRPAGPIRTRVAYGPGGEGHLRMFAVTELAPAAAREGPWLGGADAEAMLSASDNRALARAGQRLPAGRRAVLLDLGEVEVSRGEVTLRVRLMPPNGTGALEDTVQLIAPGALGDPGVPIVLRRGPTTGVEYVPTADAVFRRTERMRLELFGAAPGTAVTAALLDRTGKTIPLPVASSVRAEGAATWAVADLTLAPLAPGDYVVRMTAGDAGGERVSVTAFRVVP